MKAISVIVLFLVYSAECRKIVPIDKNANIAFINMEGGGGVRPASGGAKTVQTPNQASPNIAKPIVTPTPVTAKPAAPAPKPVPGPGQVPASAPTKAAQVPVPAKPAQQPAQISPKPLNPTPVASPITTPGPGSVKQLINFYDSQGKASPIRPYSYSQAVKQG